jgi:hypothetical protein
MRQHDGKEAICVRFAAATCRACPAQDKCTTAKWTRAAVVPATPGDPRDRHRRPRRAGHPAVGKDRYKARAGVEGLMHQATCVTGIRRARYLGLGKTRLEHLAAATAINLIRLDAWYAGKPVDRTCTTHLQRINLAPAA